MLTFALLSASLALGVFGQSAYSSCPEYVMVTKTIDAASTEQADLEFSTRSDTLTFATTVANYTRTTTITHTPKAHTVNQTTGTSTALDPTATTYTLECTSNSTVNVEYTSTVYTGSFSASSLRTTCIPSTRTKDIYASGTTTVTPTETVYDVVYNTVYTPAVSTLLLSGLVARPTTTIQVDSIVFVPGTTTSADPIDCYPKKTTATASIKTTQSIACAPSNLINGGGITDQADDTYVINDAKLAAARDASACCQLCLDDDDCAAMTYVDIVNDPYGVCTIYNSTTPACGFAAAMGSGNIVQGQAGCGFLAENIARGGGDYSRDVNHG